MRDALAPLAARAGARVVEVDVDGDAALEAKFGDRVPVLLQGDVNGTELCHFTFDRQRVMRALALPTT